MPELRPLACLLALSLDPSSAREENKADPINYRGVPLTPLLAKTLERAVGQTCVPWLGVRAFGEHQYAYSAGKSHCDTLAVKFVASLA